MTDYDRIASVIRYLDATHHKQPDLAVLARKAGLSPFHFHRLFTRWAAITPKDFLQCLTVARLKELLRAGENVLNASYGAGLSGPGRAHDLCVALEAASPGEIKSGGAGWILQAGFADGPFGKFFIAESPRGICHFSFLESESGKQKMTELQKEWPGARIQQDDKKAAQLARRIFSNRPEELALKTFVRGTAFQVRVWRALLQVQPGSVVSYGQLAKTIGYPAAARAVGSAVGQNSIAFLIPCHRVIRETGVIGQYRWGSIRKRAMLAWESAGEFGC